MYMIGIDLPVQ